MISQVDDMGLRDQLSEALNFLKQNKEQTQEELEYLNDAVKNLEESLKEIDDKISNNLKSNNSNAELFSPIKKAEKINEYNSLKKEKENIERKIDDVNSKIVIVTSKVSGYTNILSCMLKFSEIEIKNNTTPEDDLNTIKNYININSSNSDLGINVLETQENERKRIARDLHDSTVQNLTNMMHKTEICTRFIDIDPIRAKLELQTMINTIKATIHEMRNIIYNLRPMSIDDLGLVATIERYMKESIKNYEIDISLTVQNEEKHVLTVINLTLFRIVQEASSNAIKHGKATKINIELVYNEDSILLSVIDNGNGFTQGVSMEEKLNSFTGFGLSMMKERVLLLSGTLKIESNDSIGTKIIIKVPLRTFKEDDNGTN